MRKYINSTSELLILSAQKFADWTRILRSPNRAEFILTAALVGSSQLLIISWFNKRNGVNNYFSLNDHYLQLVSMTVCIFIEEFVQFSIASRLPEDNLLINCGKYAIGWWLLEFIALFPVISYVLFINLSRAEFNFGMMMFIYIRIMTLIVFFTATLTRYFSLSILKKYALILFVLQVVFHVFWNVEIAQNDNAMRMIFHPLVGLQKYVVN